MGKFTDYSAVTKLTGTETLLLAQDGVVKSATLEQLRAASPDKNGVYPDVPLNRVTIKRTVAQESTTVVLDDNLEMVNKILAFIFPVLLDRSSQIAAYLNGNDTTKTADGLDATLGDYTLQEMVRFGGIYKKYVYDAANNQKLLRISVYPVKGYTYVRRRFLPMKAGTVETQGDTTLLLSNSGKYSTQNLTVQQYHTYAKNLGDNYRDIAIQDFNIYRIMFYLLKGSYNSQSFYGITGFNDSKWSATGNTDAGTTARGQLYQLGITNSIKGHEGQLDAQTYTYSDGTTTTFKPYKFLWMEGFLAGPYWIRCTGAIKVNHKWYVAKDINTCTTFAVDDYHEYLCDAGQTQGWILETFEDTMFPTQVGGSDSKGLCDYYWLNTTDTTTAFIPVVVGGANNGSNVGVSALASDSGVSHARPHFGGALASDDPTDTIADGTVVA